MFKPPGDHQLGGLIISKYPENLDKTQQTTSKTRFLPLFWTFKDPILCKIHFTNVQYCVCSLFMLIYFIHLFIFSGIVLNPTGVWMQIFAISQSSFCCIGSALKKLVQRTALLF